MRGPVTAYVRSSARADEMRQWGERLGVDVRVADWAEAARAFDAPLVVATTPAGTTDALAQAVPDRPGTLFDVLYAPVADRTRRRLVGARRRGGRGLDLLVHQAVLQVEQMTGCVSAPLAVMRAAGERALAAH